MKFFKKLFRTEKNNDNPESASNPENFRGISRLKTLTTKFKTAIFVIVVINMAEKMHSQVIENDPNRPVGKELYTEHWYYFNPAAQANYTDTYKKDRIQAQLEALHSGYQTSKLNQYIFALGKMETTDIVSSGDDHTDRISFDTYVHDSANNLSADIFYSYVDGDNNYAEATEVGPSNSNDHLTSVQGSDFPYTTAVLGHIMTHHAGMTDTHDGVVIDAISYVDHSGTGAGYTDMEEFNSMGYDWGGYMPFFATDASDVNASQDGYIYFKTIYGEWPARIAQSELTSTDGGINNSTRIQNMRAARPGLFHVRDKNAPATPVAVLSDTSQGADDISLSNAAAVNDNYFYSIVSDLTYKIHHDDVLLYLYPANDTANDRFVAGPISVDGTFTNVAPGSYVVMAYSPSINNRTAASNQIVINTSGINKQNIAGLKIYPNPAQGKITIATGQTDIAKIRVYNQLGQQIFAENYGNQTVQAELFIDHAGLYFIEIMDNTGHVSVVKQVVR